MRGCYEQHKQLLQYAVPRPQEAKRHHACNAEVLTTHFASLNALVQEYGLDDEHVWNLDETGCTPGKDTTGVPRTCRFMRQDMKKDAKMEEFRRTGRITLMPVISAAGDVGLILFVFKGTRMPYGTVL